MLLLMINSLSDHFLGGETLMDENQIETLNHLAKLSIFLGNIDMMSALVWNIDFLNTNQHLKIAINNPDPSLQ